MKSYFLTIFTIASCVLHLSTPMKLKPPKCRGQKIKTTVEDINNIAFCINEGLLGGGGGGEDDDDMGILAKVKPKNNMACMGKCFLTKEGLIDEKGMPSKDIMIAKINATFPKDVIADMDAAMEKCVLEKGKSVDPNDTSCQSYAGLTNCMLVSFVEVCKTQEMTTAVA